MNSKKIIDRLILRNLILEGITSEELNSVYDYSEITDMSWMFDECYSLETIPKLNTSKVTDMSYMFDGCSSLESIPHLDTSKVTNMYGMFARCSNLRTIPELCTSKVTDMRLMFYSCSNLKNIDPYNYHLYDFCELDNEFLKEEYPELYI